MITVDDFLRLQKATNNQPQKECKNERTVRRGPSEVILHMFGQYADSILQIFSIYVPEQ